MTVGRVLIYTGLLLACVGVFFVGAERLNLPLGRLPGDIFWRKGSTSVYFPFATCLLLSVVVSLLLWLFSRH